MRILSALFCSGLLIMLSACSDSSTNTTTPTDTTLTAKTRTIKPDSVKDWLYSLDLDSALNVESTSSAWDMRVNHVFGGGRTQQIDVLFNSGSVNSAGSTKAYVVDTTFDNVTVADPTKFRVDSISTTGRIVSVNLDGSGLFVYNPATHMISPNPQKTLIVKSASGSYYKVQFVSLNVSASMYDLSSFVIRTLKGSGTRLK